MKEYLVEFIEDFVDKYERDEWGEDFLGKPSDVSHNKGSLEHDSDTNDESDPHTDPEPKRKELYPIGLAHLHSIAHLTCCNSGRSRPS